MNTKIEGLFFPDNKDELIRYIEHFSKTLQASNLDTKYNFNPRAIISPHAGYIYSGFTANIAFQTVQQHTKPKTIFVIGPSHRLAFQGCSIYYENTYKTPLGELKTDIEKSKIFLQSFDFLNYNEKAHQEHSTKTQMPFIKYYFPDIKIVEIVYSRSDDRQVLSLIEHILKDGDNFVVISTDLSHFYPLSRAKELDNICLNAINNLDYDLFNKGCEACGIIGVKAMVLYSKQHNLQTKFLHYTTSADVTKDTNSVVGYTSFVLGD